MAMIPYRITLDRNDNRVFGFIIESHYEEHKTYDVDIIVDEILYEDGNGNLHIKNKIVDTKCTCNSHRYNEKMCKHIQRAIEYLQEHSINK